MAADYPRIEPSSYDLVICGTGLPESLLAYAAAAAGKSVLHVDSNSFYGASFSSLTLAALPEFLRQHAASSVPDAPNAPAPLQESEFEAAQLFRRGMYADVEIVGSIPLDEPPGAFLIDLAGPKLLYCADEMVELLLRSGASHHVDFKSVDGTMFFWDGRLCSVPDSRQAIFKDTQLLSRSDKFLMTRFLKLVQSHISSAAHGAENGDGIASADVATISKEDLALPFIDFLKKQRLSEKIISLILYAITMADYDQEDAASPRIMTKDAIECITLYSSSIGRFANAAGAFIYPMYGLGELPQAFCRCAAVKGALYVLRMPVASVLKEKDGKEVGVRLASGQDILGHRIAMGPSYHFQSSNVSLKASDTSNMTRKVARAVCLISKPIDSKMSNVLVIFPPKCLHAKQLAAVRVLQLSSKVAVCPPGLFVAYLSTPCHDPVRGKESIKAAIDYLFVIQTSSSFQVNLESTTENQEIVKPTLLWSCSYVQELIQGSSGLVSSCPTPDEKLDYRNAVEVTKKLFAEVYPNEEYFPQVSAQDIDAEDDGPFADNQ